MNRTNELLQNYFQAFSAGHHQFKQQLLESLPAQQPALSWRDRVTALRQPAWLKPALAAAAVLIILLSINLFPSALTVMPDAQSAFAASWDHFSHAQSIHLNVSTNGSSMEVWWRRPNEYRMQFSNGLTIVCNEKQRCVLNLANKTFRISDPETNSMDMAVLGPFGMLFTSEEAMSAGWVHGQKLISKEEIQYKGQDCLKLTYEDGVRRGVYIVEPKLNIICAATLSPMGKPDKFDYQMEVVEIDGAFPDDIFQLTQPEGFRLIQSKRAKSTSLPVLPALPVAPAK